MESLEAIEYKLGLAVRIGRVYIERERSVFQIKRTLKHRRRGITLSYQPF